MSPDQFSPMVRKVLKRLKRSRRLSPGLVGIFAALAGGSTEIMEAIPNLDEQ